MALVKFIHNHGVRQFSVSCQHLCNKPDLYKSYKHVEAKKTKKPSTPWAASLDSYVQKRPWIEGLEIMRHVKTTSKKVKEQEFPDYRDQLFMKFQRLRPVIFEKNGFQKFLDKKLLERELMKQSFIQKRVDLLGPDIGAAHFILNRGGRVKFWGHKDWITKENMRKLLPYMYVPGLYILAIDATNTGLYYEGVDCLRYLNKLKWLRLRGLTNLNDFSLDIISGRYGHQLEYLDLTDCKGMTHLGLESFYRFKQLKGLNVTGMDHTPEFHLTCIMIQDLIPDLDIIGVDLSQYLKEDTVKEPAVESQGQGEVSGT